MSHAYKITFAASALTDLEEIRSWYIEQQVPDIGGKLIEEIISKVEHLSSFPGSGRIVPEFGINNIREIIYSPFRIIYRFDKNRVRVVRIWRSERLLRM
ncbi:MAG TPA: type II toxin-antitoxin system RelE/ParE family toxin [Deltaproteobacteria bacterium]|nr:type II toxin-antitoxin system RelE/ParE family toxin [Deltaproteobacteria bacterium]